MCVFRRGSKMKLKFVLVIFFAALITIFAWYYVNTGQNPVVDIKSKVISLVDKYYEHMVSDYSKTQTPEPADYITPPENDEKETEDNVDEREEITEIKTDMDSSEPSGEEANTSDKQNQDTRLNKKPLDHETGHTALINTRPNVEMMNALRAKPGTLSYSEGFLENARMTFYREARPSNSSKETITVLFLHGNGMTSAVWINIGTFQILAEMGYRALAVDLPGHGNSNNVNTPYSHEEILGYMTNLLAALKLHLPVLVSPSKSGEYAMPLLMAYPHVLRGLVAIAPSDTSHYSISDYRKLTVPLLVMFGEKDDTMLKPSSLDSLFYVPQRKIYMIKNTTHSCYVDHPPTFHKLLLQFLDQLKD